MNLFFVSLFISFVRLFFVSNFLFLYLICLHFCTNIVSIGDGMEYSQRKKNNLGDLIQETLEIFEMYGGMYPKQIYIYYTNSVDFINNLLYYVFHNHKQVNFYSIHHSIIYIVHFSYFLIILIIHNSQYIIILLLYYVILYSSSYFI